MKKIYKPAVSYCKRSIFFILLVFSFTSKAQESMRANLYSVDAAGTTLMDGNFTEYNDIYSNSVDMYDAWKMTNPGVNFGILRSDINLAVERRSIFTKNDTTFFRMWNMPQKNYSIKFMLKNFSQQGMHCFMNDSYLNNQTPINLNDTTNFSFTVNADPASSAEMRFQLVYAFDVVAPVDVDFLAIHAVRNANDIIVQWDVIHEQSIQSYTVQYSMDGINFNDLSFATPYNTSPTAKTYYYTNTTVPRGDHYYRIKAIRIDGNIQYSTIARISERNSGFDINVYPNPVVHKTVQLQFGNIPAGTYQPVLVYSNGMKQTLPSFQLNELQSSGSLSLPQNIVPGIYHLQFIGPGNIRIVKNIRVL